VPLSDLTHDQFFEIEEDRPVLYKSGYLGPGPAGGFGGGGGGGYDRGGGGGGAPGGGYSDQGGYSYVINTALDPFGITGGNMNSGSGPFNAANGYVSIKLWIVSTARSK
jgi:hypothetical protein